MKVKIENWSNYKRELRRNYNTSVITYMSSERIHISKESELISDEWGNYRSKMGHTVLSANIWEKKKIGQLKLNAEKNILMTVVIINEMKLPNVLCSMYFREVKMKRNKKRTFRLKEKVE